jgi:hypothetical protein
MPSKNKTTRTSKSVKEFINSYVDNEQMKKDSFELIELMKKCSGFEPAMWGPTIIGFGTYHYKYASGHEGDSLLIGFSPRKKEFSLYVITPEDEHKLLLDKLGKFTKGKSCIYFKRISDLNLDILEMMCIAAIKYIQKHHP